MRHGRLRSDDAPDHFEFSLLILEHIEGLFLVTDGLPNSFPDDADYFDLLKSIRTKSDDFGHGAVARALTRGLAKASRNGSGDDITLLSILRSNSRESVGHAEEGR